MRKMGIRNTLEDLNNHLFMQLERLNDEEIDGEKLQEEINRSKAISEVAKNIIDNGKLVLEAYKFADQRMDLEKPLPRLLEGKKSNALHERAN